MNKPKVSLIFYPVGYGHGFIPLSTQKEYRERHRRNAEILFQEFVKTMPKNVNDNARIAVQMAKRREMGLVD